MRGRAATALGFLTPALAVVLVPVLLGEGCSRDPAPPEPGPGERVLRILGPSEEPVADARVEVFRRAPHLLDPEPLGEFRSGEEGWAVLPPVGEGEGELVARVTAAGLSGEVLGLEPGSSDIQLSRGEPVEGLVIDLRGNPLSGARVVSPLRAPHLRTTTTDEQGRFRLGALAEDAWIRAEAEGFAPLDLSLSLYPDEGRDLVYYLVRERRVAGRVVDSTGKGIPGAVVVLDQECVTRIRAGEDGRFDMPGVLTDWEVVFTAHARGMVGPTLSFLVGRPDVELPLYRPAELLARAVDARTGEPLDDFEVRREGAEILGDGRFRITGLLPGEHRLEVRSGYLSGAVTVDVREGEARRGVIVPCRPPRWSPPKDYRPVYPARVRVRVESTGEPAAGARVRSPWRGQESRTGPDGVIEAVLPPGRHTLVVGGHLDRFSRQAVEVTVPSEEEVEIEVRRNPEARVELEGGVVRDRSKIWLHVGDELEEHEIGGRVLTFPATRELPITVYAEAKGYLPVLFQEILIPDDGILPVSLLEGGFIQGRCLGASGHPLAKVVAEVEEHPAEARMETLGDGCFRVGSLDEGRYRLLLYARNVRTRRYELTVSDDGVDIGDIRMAAPCDLMVQVVTSAGNPVAGARVETSYLVSAKGVTDGSGRVELPGSNPEEILRVEAPGFLPTWHDLTIPEERESLPVTVRLLRPACLLLRTVDGGGRPTELRPPEDLDLERAGPGTYRLRMLSPGPFELDLEDRDGRRGEVRLVLREGEDRVETVILR